MSWNPVLNLIKKIKNDMILQDGDLESSFEEWLKLLNDKEYNDFFESLQVNQKDEFILIRYGLDDISRGLWGNENSPYRECRSVVIDLKNEKLVTCGFRKFFNLNEVKENNLDKVQEKISQAKLFEVVDKLDGSMQNARWYNGEVFMNGSMALDESESWRLENGKSFLTESYVDMIKNNEELTFTFEYVSDKNPHVVIYDGKQEGLYLLGARDVTNGYQLTHKELSEIVEYTDVKIAQKENKSLDELLELMKKYKSNEKEGWVIRIDQHFIKIKCDDYVNMHRLLDKVSSENVIIRAIANGNFDDLYSKIPDGYRNRVDDTANKIYGFVKLIKRESKELYEKAPKESRKEFMIWVNDNVNKVLQPYVRNLYLGIEQSVLSKGKDGYKKMSEINYILHELGVEE